jgi:hypothetical protein
MTTGYLGVGVVYLHFFDKRKPGSHSYVIRNYGKYLRWRG